MAETNLNLYGDRLVSTTGAHGADIGSQRIDGLDKDALLRVLSVPESQLACLDLGCGLGWQGARFAMLGADVYFFDLLPESPLLKSLRENTDLRLSYWQGDLRLLQDKDVPSRIDIAFSQRFIHYLKYADAERLIRLIGERMEHNAYFYVSASGLGSELGVDYAGSTVPLRERYCYLNPVMQEKHDIREQVCLYKESDLTELMTAGNFSKCKVWKSGFGNVKGVFQKAS